MLDPEPPYPICGKKAQLWYYIKSLKENKKCYLGHPRGANPRVTSRCIEHLMPYEFVREIDYKEAVILEIMLS